MPLGLAILPASRLVPIVGAILAIGIVCFEGIDVARKHRATLAQANRLSIALTNVSAEYFARTFEGIDRAVIAAVDASHVYRAGELGAGDAARLRAHEVLRGIHGDTPALISIAWIDAAGGEIARSTTPARQAVNSPPLPAFAAHRDEQIGLYVGEPVRSLIDGQWIMLISRGIRDANGAFLGTVQASLNIDYLAQTYRDLQFTDDGVVSLFTRATGSLILFGAESRAHLGTSVADIATFRDSTRHGASTIAKRSTALDGKDRIMSYRAVGDFPLVAAVGFSVDSLLSAWRHDLAITGVLTLLLAGIASSGGFAFGRLLAVRERECAAQNNAEIANRAKSEFLATVSHELRTPLNGIIGYAELLAETPLDAAQRHDLEIIDTSARALHHLLNDLLDFSRIEAGRLAFVESDFDIMQTIDGAVAAVRGIATRKSLTMDVRAPPDMPMVIGDAGRVRQILLNLLGNAVKFTIQGEVRLAAHKLDSPPDRLAIHVAISDTGPGITAEAQSRLFERYSQADSTIGHRFGGAGLGLAITKSLVELMGGTIGVVSTVGEGSTFWFKLDLRLAPHDTLQEVTPRVMGPDRSQAARRVLVVDDLEVNRNLAKAILEKAGHEVELAADGREAVEKVNKGAFEAVLMDVNMPGMDGFEATARIRSLASNQAKIRIVALTASATAGDIMRCRQVGMDGHVAKPIDRHLLLEAIDAPKRWLSPTDLHFEREIPDNTVFHILDDAQLDDLERYLGRASIAGMAGMAIRRIEEMEPRLIALVAARDWRILAREAHAIVSMAGNIGAHSLSMLFRRVEVESLGASATSFLDRTLAQETMLEDLLEKGLHELQATVRALHARYTSSELSPAA